MAVLFVFSSVLCPLCTTSYWCQFSYQHRYSWLSGKTYLWNNL